MGSWDENDLIACELSGQWSNMITTSKTTVPKVRSLQALRGQQLLELSPVTVLYLHEAATCTSTTSPPWLEHWPIAGLPMAFLLGFPNSLPASFTRIHLRGERQCGVNLFV